MNTRSFPIAALCLAAFTCLSFSFAWAQQLQRPPLERNRRTGLPTVESLCRWDAARVTVTEEAWFDRADPVLVRLTRRFVNVGGGTMALHRALTGMTEGDRTCRVDSPRGDLTVEVEGENPPEPENTFGMGRLTSNGSGMGALGDYACNGAILTLTYQLPANAWCAAGPPHPRRFANFRAGLAFYRARARVTRVRAACVWYTDIRRYPPGTAILPRE